MTKRMLDNSMAVTMEQALDDEGRAKDQPAVLNGYLWPLRADAHPFLEDALNQVADTAAQLLR